MAWAAGFTPKTAAYAWDDANATVYAYNSSSSVVAFNILLGASKLWPAASMLPWPLGRTSNVADTGATFVFLAKWQRCVLFGGGGSPAVLGDTWALDPAVGIWAQVTSSGPPARRHHAGAPDAQGVLWIFGGVAASGGFLDDVWRLTATAAAPGTLSAAWAQVSPAAAGPPARQNAAITVTGGTLYLFGGQNVDNIMMNPALLQDLWALNLTSLAWSQVVPSPSIPARKTWGIAPYLASWDAAGALLVGPALADTSGTPASTMDLRQVMGTSTQVLSQGGGIVANASAIFVCQAQARAYLVQDTGIKFLQLDTASCSNVSCPAGSSTITSPTGNELNYATCCQGLATSTTTTTTTLSATASGSVSGNMAWAAGFTPTTAAYAWDDGNATVYAYSSSSSVVAFNILSGASQKWLAASSSPWPQARSANPDTGASFVFLPKWQRCVLFGGGGSSPALLGDTWALDPATGVWAQVASSGPPAPRRHHAAVADAHSVLWIFGGYTGASSQTFPFGYVDEVWRLTATAAGPGTFTAAWAQVTPAAGPSARAKAGITVTGGVLYLFGGRSIDQWGFFDDVYTDLWTLNLTSLAWSKVLESVIQGRAAGGIAPYLAAWDAGGALLVGPAPTLLGAPRTSKTESTAQDLWQLPLISGPVSLLLSSSSTVTAKESALFVCQAQARAYLVQETGIKFVQLGAANCSNVSCPAGYNRNLLPAGSELNYATCCLAPATTMSSTTTTSTPSAATTTVAVSTVTLPVTTTVGGTTVTATGTSTSSGTSTSTVSTTTQTVPAAGTSTSSGTSTSTVSTTTQTAPAAGTITRATTATTTLTLATSASGASAIATSSTPLTGPSCNGSLAINWPSLPASPSLPGKALEAFASADNRCVDLAGLLVVLVDETTNLAVPAAAGQSAAAAILGRFGGATASLPPSARVTLDPHLDLLWLAVLPGATQRGKSYHFRLQGALGWTANSNTFTMDTGPVGGSVVARPGTGQAVTTPFTLNTTWSAAQALLPLSYSFRRRAANSTVEWTLLTDWSPSTTTIAYFPAGLWDVAASATDVLGLEAAVPAVGNAITVSGNQVLNESSVVSFLSSVQSSDSPLQQLSAVSALAQALVSTSPQQLWNPAVMQPLLASLAVSGPGMGGEAQKLKVEITQLLLCATAGSPTAALSVVALPLLEQAVQELVKPTSALLLPAQAQQFLNVAVSLLPPQVNGSGSIVPELNQSQRLAKVVEGVASVMARTLLTSSQGQCGTAEQVVITSGGVTVTSVRVPAARPAAVAGLPLLQFVPSEVIAQATASLIPDPCAQIGLTGARWTSNVLGPATGPDISAASRGRCQGPVVSLSVVSPQGQKMTVENLQQPVQLSIPLAQDRAYQDFEAALLDGARPSCRWWDPQRSEWSGAGCKLLRVSGDGARLECACTHLTTLGAFEVHEFNLLVSEVVDVFVWRFICTQASMLSQQGMAILGASSWAGRPTAIIYFVFLVLIHAAWCLCLRSDVLASRTMPALGREPRAQPTRAADTARGDGMAGALCSRLQFFVHIFTKNEELRSILLTRCVHSLAAFRLGVCRETLVTLAAFEEATEDGCPDGLDGLNGIPMPFIQKLYVSLQADGGYAPGTFVRQAVDEARLFFQGKGYRGYELWAAFHPVRLVRCRSLCKRHESRYLLQLMNSLCGLFFAALFATNAGEGLAAAENGAECDSMEPVGRTLGQVLVFVLTTLAAELPANAIAKLDHNLPLTQSTGTRGILFLMGKMLFLNFCAVSLNSFYCFFVLVFISNTMEAPVQRWMLVNFLTLPIIVFLVKPGIWACAAMLLCRLHRWLRARRSSGRVSPAPVAHAALATTDRAPLQARTNDFVPVVPTAPGAQHAASSVAAVRAGPASTSTPGCCAQAVAADPSVAGANDVRAVKDVVLSFELRDQGTTAQGAAETTPTKCFLAIDSSNLSGGSQHPPQELSRGEEVDKLLADIL